MTAEQLLTNQNRLAELEKKLNEEDGKVSSLNRRLMLLEVIIFLFINLFLIKRLFKHQVENNKSIVSLGVSTLDLAKTSKVADEILKKVKSSESKTMSNEVTIEELDLRVREANQYVCIECSICSLCLIHIHVFL